MDSIYHAPEAAQAAHVLAELAEAGEQGRRIAALPRAGVRACLRDGHAVAEVGRAYITGHGREAVAR